MAEPFGYVPSDGTRGAMDAPNTAVAPGDLLRIERRYVLNGTMTTVTDTGRFRGIETIGTSEHLILQEARRKSLRLIPMTTIAEITLVRSAPRAEPAAQGDAVQAPADDPAFS